MGIGRDYRAMLVVMSLEDAADMSACSKCFYSRMECPAVDGKLLCITDFIEYPRDRYFELKEVK